MTAAAAPFTEITNGDDQACSGMDERKCLTCKHFEPSPIRRKGWCRNSLLYAPHQSHLVHQDDLDCGHRLGNYWEPADPSDEAEPVASDVVENPEAAVLQITSSSSQSNSGNDGMIARTAGSGGTGGIPSGQGSGGPSRSVPPAGGGRAGGGGGPYGSGGYQPDERYWTDYLRIAFPVIGILLMLGLFWFWANELIGDDDGNNPTPTTIVGQNTNPTSSPTGEANSPPLTEETPTEQADAEPTGTQDTEAQPTRTPRTAENSPTPDEGDDDSGSSGDFAEGDVVVTSDAGVRFRSEPALDDGNVIAELPEGTELTVTGPPEEDSDGNVFVPVEDEDGEAGYVSADFVELK
jgi:hypothetical protein